MLFYISSDEFKGTSSTLGGDTGSKHLRVALALCRVPTAYTAISMLYQTKVALYLETIFTWHELLSFRWYVDSRRLLTLCVFNWPPVALLLFSARYRSVTCTQISSLRYAAANHKGKSSGTKVTVLPITYSAFGVSIIQLKKGFFFGWKFRKLII